MGRVLGRLPAPVSLPVASARPGRAYPRWPRQVSGFSLASLPLSGSLGAAARRRMSSRLARRVSHTSPRLTLSGRPPGMVPASPAWPTSASAAARARLARAGSAASIVSVPPGRADHHLAPPFSLGRLVAGTSDVRAAAGPAGAGRGARRGVAAAAPHGPAAAPDQAELEILRHRVDQLELRLATLEQRWPAASRPPRLRPVYGRRIKRRPYCGGAAPRSTQRPPSAPGG